jgi:tartrate dehydratase beta subunit/fumarate hydratase class I family protein
MRKIQQKQKAALRIDQYKSAFLQPTAFLARDGKTVYISKEFHKKLSLIVLVLGGGKMTLADYMQNLLKLHFEDFGAEIKEIHNSKDKLIL